MIASLAPLFVGPLQIHAGKLRLADTAAQPAAEFFQAQRLAAFIDELQARRQGGDRRALTSIWSKWYFSTFLASTLAASLMQQRSLPIALDQVGLVLDDTLKPQALTLPDEGQVLAQGSPFERFAALIEGHLEPVVHSLAAVCRASPRLFWSNVGNTFEFVITRIELHPLARPGMTAPGRAILASRLRPDGTRNPLFSPVYYRDGSEDEAQRVRRICCIRYRLPGIGYCSSCPLDPARRDG